MSDKAVADKARDTDLLGRFREVISDPLNLLIERVPAAGMLVGDEVCLHNGIWVPFSGQGAYYGAFSQLLVLNRGVHEPLEEYAFQELLKSLGEAPFMIELGAYWGHYSMWLKKLRPRSTVVLVEPERQNLEAGIANFARNGFQGEFIQAFVARGQFELDSFLTSRNISRLDILHVDIQGYEVEMIAGGRRTLGEHFVDYLFVSTHSQELHQRVLNELKAAGYRIEISSDFDNETTSYDGFVFASSSRIAPLFGHFNVLGRSRINVSRPGDLLGHLSAQRAASRSAASG